MRRRIDNYSEELEVVASQNLKERDYWFGKLSGPLPRIRFPYDNKKPITGEYRSRTLEFRLFPGIYEQLMKLSKESDEALHMILLAGVVVVLHKYTSSNDLVVGIPLSKKGIEGDYINTALVIRLEINDKTTMKDLLLQTRQVIIEAEENANYPIEILTNQLHTAVSPGDDDFSLFDVVVLLDSLHDKRDIDHIPRDMAFDFKRTGEGMELFVEYNGSMYGTGTIKQIVKHFNHLLEKTLVHIDQRLSVIDVLTEEDRAVLLNSFNNTHTAYPRDKTIPQLFEKQERETPDRVALDFEDHSLTYNRLNRQANRLARVLRKKGAASDSIVGLLMERSMDVIVGILGILKAGAAYLPIDPGTPLERVEFMLRDCQVALLLTRTPEVEKYPFSKLQDIQSINASPTFTSPRPQVKDFDCLPIPDRSMVNYEKYTRYIGQGMVKNSITIQATRGCPYNCAYCCRVWPKTYVTRSARHIFEEVCLYYNIGIRRYVFIDDIFNLDRFNSMEFFRLIIANRLNVQLLFPSGLRGDLLTKEYIDLMVEAGTISFPLALETASPRLQTLIRKNLNIEKLRENMVYIIDNHPHVILELHTMHGFPTETEEEAMKTLDFIKSLKWIHFPYIHILRIFPNTEMMKLALANGIAGEAIARSENLAYHQVPETLPFDKNFTLRYQADFLNNYFLSRERLLHVLPYQMKRFTEDEIVQKYNSYLSVDISTLEDLLQFVGIRRDELGVESCLEEESLDVPGLNREIAGLFQEKLPSKTALRVLLLDLSQLFSSESQELYDVVEQPLGLMYLMAYLHGKFPRAIHGKIAKSRIDFDNYAELKILVEEFQPDVLGLRTLTIYRDFFHKIVAMIRHWGIRCPIIAGGPYATVDTRTLLQDQNIDLAVLGEGELTFAEIVREMIANNGKLPDESVLKEIAGIAFIPGTAGKTRMAAREILVLDALPGALEGEANENLKPVNKASSPAYIIFTSGSTGKPKGIFTTHFNAVRVVKNTNYIDLTVNDRVLQLSNYAFDGSVFDIYGALLNGAGLVLVKLEDILAVDRLSHLIARKTITTFFVTTALFNALVDIGIDGLKNIRKVLFGGERVSVEHTVKAFQYMGKDRVVHVYGPTETTVYATYYNINHIDKNIGTIPIGKPLANTTVYILNKGLKLVPIGVSSEIYIGGEGLALGYLNRPALTAGSFIKNPFTPGERLYKSGDLGRWLPEGDIEFISRIDHQVKIRGFRVEMGEIESRLLEYPHIKEAAVMLRETSGRVISSDEPEDRFLCAYIAAEAGYVMEITQLKEYLSRQLPRYMVPTFFIQLDNLPLTSNGKINRKALPAPKAGSHGKDTGYEAPRDEIEKKLAAIWTGLLFGEDARRAPSSPEISIEADFFEMGGHSLKALHLLNAIQKEFNVKIDFKDIFQYPTIAELSRLIRKSEPAVGHEIQIQPEKEYYNLSYSQWRLMVLYQLDPDSPAFNLPTRITLYEPVDETKILKVMEKWVKRHDSFRTYFKPRQGDPVQIILPQIQVKLEIRDLSHLSDTELEKNRQQLYTHMRLQPFKLDVPPLFRVGLIKCREEEFDLILIMHHIITDGWSMEILEHEFKRLYKSYKKNCDHDLPSLKNRYIDYVYWLESLLADKKNMQKATGFWRKQLEEDCPILDLPYDFSPKNCNDGSPPGKKSAGYRTVIPGEIMMELKKIAKQHNASLFMVLLAGFNLLLYRLTGQDDILLGVPGAARQHQDLKNIVGFFVNTLILRNKINPGETFIHFLSKVQENTIQVLEYQSFPLDLLCSRYEINYPKISVFFNMSIFLNTTQENLESDSSYHIQSVQDAKFDMVCYLGEYKNGIPIHTHYYKELFKPQTIEGIMQLYRVIMEDISRDPGKKINQYKCSLSGKKRKLRRPALVE